MYPQFAMSCNFSVKKNEHRIPDCAGRAVQAAGRPLVSVLSALRAHHALVRQWESWTGRREGKLKPQHALWGRQAAPVTRTSSYLPH